MKPATQTGQLILLIGRDPFTVDGGGPTYVRACGSAAIEAGLEPIFFAIQPRSWGTTVEQTPLGPIYRVGTPLRGSPWTTLPLHAPLLRRAVVKHIRNRPGRYVVHGFSSWADLGPRVRSRLQKRGCDVELVTTAWTTIGHEARAKLASEVVQSSPRKRAGASLAVVWNQWINQPIIRRVCQQSRVVLVNYDSVAQLLRADYGPDMNIRRIGYLSESAFHDEAINPATRKADLEPPLEIAKLLATGLPMILAMSRHDGRKGLDVLIRSLAILRDRGVKFVACIGGGGPLLGGHQALTTSLNLEDRVVLTGSVPEVLPYLKVADIFALPSIEEGSGSVAVLEALQAGLAVVSTDVDGMTEDLTDGVDALLVPPADEIALADALERLVQDAPLRRRLATAGRELFEAEFSREAVLPEIAQLYAELGILSVE